MIKEKTAANLLKTDVKFVTNFIISKFFKFGFDNLTTEELAFTLITPSFSEEFAKQTGDVWSNNYQLRTLNKLKQMNIDLTFINYSKGCAEEFTNFFFACSSGNLNTIKDYFKRYKLTELISLYDISGKNPLHHAVKQGHMTVVELLISKGFNSELRDKLFRTSLHLACLLGHAVIAEFLIKSNIDSLNSKDLRGRGCIHFAACAPTSNCLSIILSYSKELISLLDSYGRSALHYAVLNSSPEQLDVIRILLENGADLNAVDKDGRTVLHYVAEAGITRAIPFLIQKGIDLSKRDYKKQKTAIELAVSDKIREIIIVYSTNPHKTTLLEDRKILAKGSKGTDIDMPKEMIYSDEIVNHKNKLKVSKKDNWAVPEFIHNKIYDLLKNLQENGVATNQHISKPHLFNGSWLEGINTLDELYAEVKDIPSSEAMLRTFNVLYPYEGELSTKEANQTAIANFYGLNNQPEKCMKTISDNKNYQSVNLTQSTMTEAQKLAFESMVKSKEIEILNLKEEIIKLKAEKEINDDVIKLKMRYEKEIEELKSALNEKEVERKALKENMKMLKYSFENLKTTNEKNEQDRQLKAQKIKNLQKNIDMLNQNIETFQAEIEILKKPEYNNKKSQAIIKTKDQDEKRTFLLKNITTNEDIAFSKLMHAIKKNKINLISSLETEDGDADGKLTRYEFTTFLQRYLKNSVRVYTIINFFELNKKYNDVHIKDIKEVLEKRNLLAEKMEQELIGKLLNAFKKQGLDPETFERNFDINKYDADGNKELNISEFKGVLEDLNILYILDDESIKKLFSLIDEDDSETISLEELKHRLLSVKLLNDAKNGDLNLSNKKKSSSSKIQIAKKLQLASPTPSKFNVNDTTIINGELKIQFLNLQASINSDLLQLKARIPGLNKNWILKKIKGTNIEEFRYACRLPIDHLLPENLSNQLIVIIENDNAEIGKAYINWKSTLDTKDKWIVHKIVKFDDGSTITVQLKFIPSNNPLTVMPKVIKNFKVDKNIDGRLSIKFVDLTEFIEAIKKDRNNVEIFFINYNNEKTQLKPTFDGQKFLFDDKIESDIQCEGGEFVNSLIFTLKTQTGITSEVYIDFSEALHFPNQDMQNKYFYLLSSKNEQIAKLHCSVKFCSNDVVDNTKIEGTLKIKVNRARNLITDDIAFFAREPKINPYFKVRMKLNMDKELEYCTEKALSNFNPEYNEDIIFDLEILKAIDFATGKQIVPFLHIELWDYQETGDNFIANCDINWVDCYETPGKWNINQFIELYASSGKIMGEVYISCNYTPKDTSEHECDFIDIEALPIKDPFKNKVVGKFYLKAIYLMDLVYINSNYILEKDKEIRPFIEILMPNGKRYQSLTTKISDKFTDVDIYMINEDFETDFDFDDISTIKDLKIYVKHEEDFSNNDKVISILNVPVGECVKCPGDWVINQPFYLLQDPEALTKTGIPDVGRILLQARYIPEKTYSNSLCPKLPDYFEKYIDNDKKHEGKLIFNIVNCRDLPICDSGLEGTSCDPFVVISLIGAEKTKVKSDILKNTLNPDFNQTLSLKLSILESNADDCSIKIEVFDYDRFSGNDFIGSVLFEDIKTILSRPNEWAVDRVFTIKLAKTNPKLNSQIYLQMKYEPNS